MQRHRHQEFIRFLNAVEAAVPAGKLVHVILDNYGTHKHQGDGVARPAPALDLPLHPDLRLLAECRRDLLLGHDPPPIRRGVFHSLVDLQAAIHRYLAEHNADPKPFVWTATPRRSWSSWSAECVSALVTHRPSLSQLIAIYRHLNPHMRLSIIPVCQMRLHQ